MEGDKSVPDLLDEVRAKERRYLIGCAFSVVITMVLILVFVYIKINSLQNHINCIVDLFAQPNRQSLVISDVQNCKIQPVK